MSDYTKLNVRDIEDKAPEFGFGEIQEARFPNDELGCERTGVGHHRLKPDKRQGFGHAHEEAEEVYYVVAGAGSIQLDDDNVALEVGDFIRIAPRVKRRLEAGSDGLEYLTFGARHDGDGEVHPEFWAP